MEVIEAIGMTKEIDEFLIYIILLGFHSVSR